MLPEIELVGYREFFSTQLSQNQGPTRSSSFAKYTIYHKFSPVQKQMHDFACEKCHYVYTPLKLPTTAFQSSKQ